MRVHGTVRKFDASWICLDSASPFENKFDTALCVLIPAKTPLLLIFRLTAIHYPSLAMSRLTFTDHALANLSNHAILLSIGGSDKDNTARIESIKSSPIFTAAAGRVVDADPSLTNFNQYALLGMAMETFRPVAGQPTIHEPTEDDQRIFLNGDTPQSAFICGVQGSGKSNSLAVILGVFTFLVKILLSPYMMVFRKLSLAIITDRKSSSTA